MSVFFSSNAESYLKLTNKLALEDSPSSSSRRAQCLLCDKRVRSCTHRRSVTPPLPNRCAALPGCGPNLSSGYRYSFKDTAKGRALAQTIDTGIVWVNTWLHRDLRTPFGGVKNSGVGREGGQWSMGFFSETTNICVKDQN